MLFFLVVGVVELLADGQGSMFKGIGSFLATAVLKGVIVTGVVIGALRGLGSICYSRNKQRASKREELSGASARLKAELTTSSCELQRIRERSAALEADVSERVSRVTWGPVAENTGIERE